MTTVKELIEILKEFPEDTLICISGYEGGYRDIENAEEVKVILNVNDEWYYGPHEITESKDGVDYILIS